MFFVPYTSRWFLADVQCCQRMKLYLEEGSHPIVLAPSVDNVINERLINAGMSLILAGITPSWVAVLVGADSLWVWIALALSVFIAFICAWIMCQGRYIFEDSEIRFEGTSTLIPFVKRFKSYPREGTRLIAKLQSKHRAAVVLERSEPTRGANIPFNVAGVWLPEEINELKERLGYPAEATIQSEQTVAKAWARQPLPKMTLTEVTPTCLEYRAPPGGPVTFLFVCVILLVGPILAFLDPRPASLIAGTLVGFGVLCLTVAIIREMGSGRFRIDSDRKEVVNHKHRPYERVPFSDVRCVVIRKLPSGMLMSGLLHRNGEMILLYRVSSSHQEPMEAFSGEVAKRIGVPLYARGFEG